MIKNHKRNNHGRKGVVQFLIAGFLNGLLFLLGMLLLNGGLSLWLMSIPAIILLTAIFFSIKGFYHGIKAVSKSEEPAWLGYIALLSNGLLVVFLLFAIARFFVFFG